MLKIKDIGVKETIKRLKKIKGKDILKNKKIEPETLWLLRSNFINKAISCFALYARDTDEDKDEEDKKDWLQGGLNALYISGATDLTLDTIKSIPKIENKTLRHLRVYKVIQFLSQQGDRI